MVDGIGKCPDALTVLDKVKDIIKTFTYKTAMLEKEAQAMTNEAAASRLSGVSQEINTDCMISTPASDDDETQEAEHVAATMQTASAATAEPKSVHSTTSLKKYCPTRWNTILTMLDSLIENQTLVERCLSQLRLFDKMCSNEEIEIILGLSCFLKVFKTANEVLCGEKYPTVSLVLLFRAEIEHALEITPTDCSLVRELKENRTCSAVWIIGCLLQTCRWQQLC